MLLTSGPRLRRELAALAVVVVSASLLIWALMACYAWLSVRQHLADDVDAAIGRVAAADSHLPYPQRLTAWVSSLSALPPGYQVSSRLAGPYQPTPLPPAATSEDLSAGRGVRVPLTDPLTGEVRSLFIRDESSGLVSSVHVSSDSASFTSAPYSEYFPASAPTSLRTSVSSSGGADVSWLPPANSGGLPVEHYVLLTSPDSHAWSRTALVDADRLSAHLTASQARGVRWVRLLAVTQAGIGAGAAAQLSAG